MQIIRGYHLHQVSRGFRVNQDGIFQTNTILKQKLNSFNLNANRCFQYSIFMGMLFIYQFSKIGKAEDQHQKINNIKKLQIPPSIYHARLEDRANSLRMINDDYQNINMVTKLAFEFLQNSWK